jgi:hypothetical protein
MKLQEAHKITEQRWIDLGLQRKDAPVMFNVDVESLLEDNPEEGAEPDDERARR